jgi:hypothetical protein
MNARFPLPMLSDEDGRDYERDFWEAYLEEYIDWKRNPIPVEEYKGVSLMGGLLVDNAAETLDFEVGQIPVDDNNEYGFDPDDIMGGVDCDGAPWGAHPFVKTKERPAAVNWAIVRALFWTPWRITNYITKETGRNQAHPDGALAAQFLFEARADQMVQDL